MAQIKAILARGLLDDIAANAGGQDLIDAIRNAKKSVFTTSFKQGRIYVSTSGSGQSASFLIPTELTSEYTPTMVAAQFQEFVEIYNDCVTQGLITDSSDNEADLAVMLLDDRLQTVTHRRLDVTAGRWPGSTLQA